MSGNSAPVYESQVSSNKKNMNYRLGQRKLNNWPCHFGPQNLLPKFQIIAVQIVYHAYTLYMLVKRVEILTFFTCKECYPPNYRARAS